MFRPFGRSRRLARDLNLQGRFAALPMRFSCKPALAQLAALKQGASLPRFPLRCSAAPDGWEIKTQNNTLNQPPHSRLHSLSTAANPGSRRAPCLRQVYLPSCARPRIGEERKESAIADECTGVPFSLGTFSWALKRKYLALQGEIRRKKKNPDRIGKTLHQ